MRNNKQFFGFGSLIAVTFLYGFYSILIRFVGFSLPLFYAGWTRNLIACVILGIVLFIRKSWKPMKHNDFLWIAVRSIAGAIGFYSAYIAFNISSIGTTYFILYAVATIGGYIIGNVVYKERITYSKVISIMLSIIGLSLLFSVSFSNTNPLPFFLSLLAGVSTAIWNTFSKKVSHKYSATQLSFLDFGISMIFAFILSILLSEAWVVPTVSTVWIASMLFVTMFLVAGYLMIIGFKYVEAQIGSLCMLLEVVFGILFAYVFYHETISYYTALGGMCIFISILLPEFHFLKGNKK